MSYMSQRPHDIPVIAFLVYPCQIVSRQSRSMGEAVLQRDTTRGPLPAPRRLAKHEVTRDDFSHWCPPSDFRMIFRFYKICGHRRREGLGRGASEEEGRGRYRYTLYNIRVAIAFGVDAAFV